MVTIFGLDIWVAIAALAAALVSATQVITKEVVVPWRKKAAGNALACLGYSGRTYGTAFQIAPKRWVTASHVLQDRREPSGRRLEPELKIGDAWVPASLVYLDRTLDLAVLAVQTEWPWSAKVSWDLPEQGSVVDVTGWTLGGQIQGGGDRDVRVTLRYTIQGPAEDTLIVLAGAAPPAGFSGSPVTDSASGRVMAVVLSHLSGDNGSGLPSVIDQVHAVPLACIPAQYRQ